MDQDFEQKGHTMWNTQVVEVRLVVQEVVSDLGQVDYIAVRDIQEGLCLVEDKMVDRVVVTVYQAVGQAHQVAVVTYLFVEGAYQVAVVVAYLAVEEYLAAAVVEEAYQAAVVVAYLVVEEYLAAVVEGAFQVAVVVTYQVAERAAVAGDIRAGEGNFGEGIQGEAAFAEEHHMVVLVVAWYLVGKTGVAFLVVVAVSKVDKQWRLEEEAWTLVVYLINLDYRRDSVYTPAVGSE